jgi:hypothetical protein
VGSRVEELRIHGDQALEAALDLQLGASMDELGYGTGLASHPPYTTMPLAGAMPLPSYAFPLPEELPEQDVSETFEEGTDQTTPDSVE